MTYIVTYTDEQWEELHRLVKFCGNATASLLEPLEEAEYRPDPQEALAFDLGAAAVRESERRASFWFKK